MSFKQSKINYNFRVVGGLNILVGNEIQMKRPGNNAGKLTCDQALQLGNIDVSLLDRSQT